MSKIRLPATLAFVIVSAGGAIAACDSDGGKTADAGQDCSYTCVPDSSDDGGPMGDGGVSCPMCADQNHECPSGCIPIGLA
jgi:hypothetical protein